MKKIAVRLGKLAFVVFVVVPAYLFLSKKYDDPDYWREQRKKDAAEGPPGWF